MRLKELRKERNLLQKEVAKAIGTSQANIGRWESGQNEPSSHYVIALADFFGVSADYLLGREDDFGNVAINADLSEEEKEILKTYRNLSPKQKETFTAFIKNYDTLMNK